MGAEIWTAGNKNWLWLSAEATLDVFWLAEEPPPCEHEAGLKVVMIKANHKLSHFLLASVPLLPWRALIG
eukprot:c36195_g1_i1 orf=2-208(-)